MRPFLWLVFVFHAALSLHIPGDLKRDNKQDNKNDRSFVVGDVSYSYSATDIGSKEGSHVKTITIIKNVALPKEQDDNLDNVVKLIVKVPTLAHYPHFQFHDHDHGHGGGESGSSGGGAASGGKPSDGGNGNNDGGNNNNGGNNEESDNGQDTMTNDGDGENAAAPPTADVSPPEPNTETAGTPEVSVETPTEQEPDAEVVDPNSGSVPVDSAQVRKQSHRFRNDYETKLKDPKLHTETYHHQTAEYDLHPVRLRVSPSSSSSSSSSSSAKAALRTGTVKNGQLTFKSSSAASLPRSEKLTLPTKDLLRDVEFINSDAAIQSRAGLKSQSIHFMPRSEDSFEDILEDFSDFSMHNVKHISDNQNIETLARLRNANDDSSSSTVEKSNNFRNGNAKYQQEQQQQQDKKIVASGAFISPTDDQPYSRYNIKELTSSSLKTDDKQSENLKHNNKNIKEVLVSGGYQINDDQDFINYDKFIEILPDPKHKGRFQVKYTYKLRDDSQLASNKPKAIVPVESDKSENYNHKYEEVFLHPSPQSSSSSSSSSSSLTQHHKTNKAVYNQKQISSSHVTVQNGNKAVTFTSSSDPKSNLKTYVAATNPSAQPTNDYQLANEAGSSSSSSSSSATTTGQYKGPQKPYIAPMKLKQVSGVGAATTSANLKNITTDSDSAVRYVAPIIRQKQIAAKNEKLKELNAPAYHPVYELEDTSLPSVKRIKPVYFVRGTRQSRSERSNLRRGHRRQVVYRQQKQQQQQG